MADSIERVAKELGSMRQAADPVSEASHEVLPYKRRIEDALRALRALVTDDTPSTRLESDLRVVEGLIAALIGAEKATWMIEALPEIRRLVASDVESAFEGDPGAASYGQVVASSPSVLAVCTYRIAHVFYELGEPAVARMMSEEAHSRTGIDIHPGAQIGRHFFMDHGTGVVIGETCEIGHRVKLYHGVTLGAFSNKAGRGDVGKKRHPSIGSEVTIYPNATILGGDTVIGEGCVIGGNVWLTRSVARYTRVTIEFPKLQVEQKAVPELGAGI
jgi:serine O-acetyltransferase